MKPTGQTPMTFPIDYAASIVRSVAIASVVPIAATLAASSACAAPVYVEETWYELTYYSPRTSIRIEEFSREHLPPETYIASYRGENENEVTWWSPGLIIKEGLHELPGGGRGFVLEFSVGSMAWGNSGSRGFLEFNGTGSVIDWDFVSWDQYGESIRSRADGSVLDLSDDYRNIIDIELIQGMTVYDEWSWAPDNAAYSTRPGRWSVFAGQACYTTDTYQDVGCPTTPAPVPLPLSVFTLLGAIVGLVAVTRRRFGTGTANLYRPMASPTATSRAFD